MTHNSSPLFIKTQQSAPRTVRQKGICVIFLVLIIIPTVNFCVSNKSFPISPQTMAVTTSLIMLTSDASSLATQRIPLLTTSTDTADGHPLTVALKPLMSHKTYTQALYGLSCALIYVGTFGIISNILVLTNFLKIGFKESINISFFALGISDLGLTITMSWGGILNLLILTETRLPFNAFNISSVTVYWPSEGLEKTTTCITAYIAMERLVSVVFPLHVKKIMTRRKTAIVLGLIFLLVFGPTNMSAFIWKLEWVFDPAMNETILRSNRQARDNFYLRSFLDQFLIMHLLIVVHFTGLTILWISTIFLAITLSRNIKARESSLGHSKTVASQVKNIRVIKTVLLIAGVYLACSTPKTVSSLISGFDDRFSVDGVYFRSYMIVIVICVLLSLVNSSVNIFIYFNMSTKFRDSVKKLLWH